MRALIGHTGFVGGNLAVQYQFDDVYNSKTVENIAGKRYDWLAVSAMPAAMWIANKDPDADRANLDRLTACLERVQAQRLVLMSTVAVYPSAVGVDEDSPLDPMAMTPYGRHRYLLEQFVAQRFPQHLIVRLPALFGPGLKKNALYDLLHDNETHKINSQSRYQFYDLTRLRADIERAEAAGLSLVNFATAPISVAELAGEVLDREFANDPGTPPASYDMRTRHAGVWSSTDYIVPRTEVIAGLRRFAGGAS